MGRWCGARRSFGSRIGDTRCNAQDFTTRRSAPTYVKAPNNIENGHNSANPDSKIQNGARVRMFTRKQIVSGGSSGREGDSAPICQGVGTLSRSRTCAILKQKPFRNDRGGGINRSHPNQAPSLKIEPLTLWAPIQRNQASQFDAFSLFEAPYRSNTGRPPT